MRRLVSIEFLKLKHSKSLWVLLGLYVILMVVVSFSGGWLLQYIADQGVKWRGIDPTILPIYDFEDIWQNLTYLSSFLKLLPAFLIIISICNEYTYRTHKQNIIDGLSRKEFFLSKLAFSSFLAFLSAGLVGVLGLILGFANSEIRTWEAIFSNIEFLAVHLYQLILFFLFAMLAALVLKRSGLTIVGLIFYTLFIEPITATIVSSKNDLYNFFFPVESIASLIEFPFTRYLLMETNNSVSLLNVGVAGLWGAAICAAIWYFLVKRDL
jgi:ABC-type transport system involved in multi-copper enzyme maturation permease subunit